MEVYTVHVAYWCCNGVVLILWLRRLFVNYPPTYKVLEDVTEIEMTAEGKKLTKLDQILLNGNNIALLVPGGKPDDVEW